MNEREAGKMIPVEETHEWCMVNGYCVECAYTGKVTEATHWNDMDGDYAVLACESHSEPKWIRL